SAPGDWDNLPAAAEPYVRGAERALRRVGFGEPRLYTTPAEGDRRTMAQYSFHPGDRTVASLLVAIAPRRLSIVIVAFHTWWDDGSHVVTSNSDESVWPGLKRPPNVEAIALPGLE